MIKFRLASATAMIVFAVLMVIPFELLSQHRHGDFSSEPYPVFQRIEDAVESGIITRDDAILQKLYAGINSEMMDERFRSEGVGVEPIKCLTPVIIEYEQSRERMDPAVVHKIEELMDDPESQAIETYLSSSGKFRITFGRTGSNAVPDEDLDENGIPDYVEKTAFAADSSYRYQIETLGFRDFIKNDPYEISYQNFSGTYGITSPSGSSTRIILNNDFDGFPPNLHSQGNQIGALFVTIAHEMKHASQYEINRWREDTGSFDWIEMDATLMEHVVFEDVSDYYNYIMSYEDEKSDWNRNNPSDLSIFGDPGSATPGAYNHVTWMIYFYEVFGVEFWVEVWDEIDQAILDNGINSITFLDAMNRVLNRYDTSIESEHLKNHMWHMSSGPEFSNYEFGFIDRVNYPVASQTGPFQLSTDERTVLPNQPPLQSFAARYHDLIPSSIALGQPSFILDSDINGLFLGVVGYFRDGSVQKLVSQNPNSAIQSIQTTWSWPELVDLNITVVNTSNAQSADYSLEIISAIPENDLITQNYPNPFNPVTRIDFALNDTKDVRLEVYNILGRKVATLVDERRDGGFHSVLFDGSGLASGVYIYRIITDQTVQSEKMILVK